MSAPQPPIGDYALLGDTRTAALVSRRGSIDWLCLPRFDADPIFGTLIDAEHGGRFELGIDGGEVAERAYRPDSTVLETRWRAAGGSALVTEAMPVDVSGMRPQLALVRQIECTAGEVEVRVLYDPRFALPGRPPERIARRRNALFCEWGSLALVLQSFGGELPQPGVVEIRKLRQGQLLTLMATMADRGPAVLLPEAAADQIVAANDRDWRQWCSEIDYDGPFRKAVVRSLITLRLLTYSPSGAPVAAPTMSLPERIGGDLNWDYRYAWPRDAGIGSGAFLAGGRADEAKALLRWLEIASRLTRPKISVLYTLDGTVGHHEREIAGVTGYRGSLPVRAANGAATQHQLDVYGWVVDTAWHLQSRGLAPDGPSWRMTRDLADFVSRRWREPDMGIWERRGEPRQHVSSKFLAYVALNRVPRMARSLGRDLKRVKGWEEQREALAVEVRRAGWSESLKSYTAVYGTEELDASLLLVAMSELEDGQPERISSTIDAIRRELGAGGPLLYRYLGVEEGAFLACSFWLADALARCGRIEEAEEVLGEAVGLGGELGLLAEEVDPASGEMLGNHPQALSHATLVAAAASLEVARAARSRPRSRRRPREPAA